MQISLKYHGQNFESFNQLLDPVTISNTQQVLKISLFKVIKHGMKLFQDIIPQSQKENKIFKKG